MKIIKLHKQTIMPFIIMQQLHITRPGSEHLPSFSRHATFKSTHQ
jgi:hypothetical protein